MTFTTILLHQPAGEKNKLTCDSVARLVTSSLPSVDFSSKFSFLWLSVLQVPVINNLCLYCSEILWGCRSTGLTWSTQTGSPRFSFALLQEWWTTRWYSRRRSVHCQVFAQSPTNNWMNDRLTDRSINWLADRRTDRLTDLPTDWLTERLNDQNWLTDTLTDWRTHWPTDPPPLGLTDGPTSSRHDF